MLPCWSGPGSNGNEGILHILQSSSITGASPSNGLVSYPGQSLGEEVLPLCRDAVGVFYRPSDWAGIWIWWWAYCTSICVCVWEREREREHRQYVCVYSNNKWVRGIEKARQILIGDKIEREVNLKGLDFNVYHKQMSLVLVGLKVSR